MPKHEFGLMNNPPVESKRYDKYNPEEYDNLISVDDNYIMRIADELNEIHMYWHTLKNSQKEIGILWHYANTTRSCCRNVINNRKISGVTTTYTPIRKSKGRE